MESLQRSIFLVLLLVITFACATQEDFNGSSLPPADVMKRAVEGLLGRLLHHRAREFVVEIREGTGGRDYFKVFGEGVEGRPVYVRAGTGVGAALGVMTFLKYLCNASVSWEADLLSGLPAVWPRGSVEAPLLDRYRFYNNPCVFSYSYAFWTWHRWEREIDLMALMGINLALALEGQEALWRQVYLALGLTEGELEDHLAGYAFLAWGRMGNIRRWGGPLSLHWMQERFGMQKRIVTRMREFGMFTVLPAFSGHVPEGLLRLFPEVNMTRLPAWGHFPDLYTRTYFLDPKDPLFEKIGAAFIRKVTLELGSDHFYLSDPFNEMTPVSPDLTYLQGVSQSIYASLREGDPQAVWVTQGWMFLSDTQFWQKPQARAYLTAVPQGKMLVLDLAAEVYPQYSRLESFFGQPFVFCLLNNYGGVRGMFGNVGVLLKNLKDARQYPNSSMVGTGMTPEGIGSNYVVFDLMSELSWKSHINSMEEWAVHYSRRRYGAQDKRLEEAWNLLMSSVYNCSEPIRFHGRFTPLMRRPTLNPQTRFWYRLADLVRAWDLLVDTAHDQATDRDSHGPREHDLTLEPARAQNEVLWPITGERSDTCSRHAFPGNAKRREFGRKKQMEENGDNMQDDDGRLSKGRSSLLEEGTFRYDLVEVTRELLQVAASGMIKRLIGSYRNRDAAALEDASQQLQDLIEDMDLLLGTHCVFLLGGWLQGASSWANNTQEHDLLRRNSLYQISLWGPNGEVLDYAVKQWNGVMKRYVAPRWGAFGSSLSAAVTAGVAFDEAKFKRQVFEAVEKPFADDLDTAFPATPHGDAVNLAIKMHEKYRPQFTRRRLVKQYMKLLTREQELKDRRAGGGGRLLHWVEEGASWKELDP